MRKTTLHRTIIAMAGILIAISVLLGVLRNTITRHQVEQKNHQTHIHQQPHESQATLGAALFNNQGCTHCHYTESTKNKIGPGLKGLFDRDKLPVSQRPVNEKNVRKQLKNPYENMPSYADRLSQEEFDQLISYLKTL